MMTYVPDVARSVEDRRRLLAKTLASVEELCAFLGEDVPSGGCDTDDLHLLHPAFFSWYFQLKAKAFNISHLVPRGQQVTFDSVAKNIASSRLRAHDCCSEYGVFMDIHPRQEFGSNAPDRAMQMAAEIHNVLCKIDTQIELSSTQISTIQSTFRIIKLKWPELLSEMEEHVQVLTFFSAPKIIGFTDFQSHGSIFLRDTYITTAERLAEELIHEGSHTRLNAIMATTPLYTNNEEPIYSSPLRKEPRPMYGIFHQMFVLARINMFYRLMGLGDDARARAVVTKLNAAMNVVSDHAQLTAEGKEMVSSIIEGEKV